MKFIYERSSYFTFWVTGLFYQFWAPLVCKKVSPDGDLATLCIGVLLASSFGDIALNSSLIRTERRIRQLILTRVILYSFFLIIYGVIFKVSTVFF